MSQMVDAREGIVRNDGFQNVATRAGTRRDKREGWKFASRFFNSWELDELYASSALAARICDLVADDMVRETINISGPDEETTQAISAELDRLCVKSVLGDGIRWARLHGGGLVFIGAVDGKKLDEPLDPENISTIDYLEAFDRWDWCIETVNAFGAPATYRRVRYDKYGLEARQEVDKQVTKTGDVVHASRFLRFDGTKTSRRRQRMINQGWADSVFVRLFEPIRGYTASWTSAEALLEDFAQAVIKIQDLATLMATDGEDKVLARLEMMDFGRSTMRAMILDAENEDFDRKPAPMSGLPEVLDRFLSRIAGAAEMPITLLFGTSPNGLNATGDNDVRFYYDTIARKQERELRGPMQELLNLICLQNEDGPTGGEIPDSMTFKFRSLWQMSESDLADIRKTTAETDQLYLTAGIIRDDEVARSRFGKDGWSMETQLDWATRDAMAAAEAAELASGGDDVQKQAFNGAQGSTALQIITSVSQKQIPRDTGVQLLAMLFQIDVSEADKRMGSAGADFEPAPPPGQANGGNPEDGGKPKGDTSPGEKGKPQGRPSTK